MDGRVQMSTTTATSCRGLLNRIMEEETKASEKQGIGSILASEPDRPKTAASLRRTLSADMSSKKWFGRHDGVTLLRKIPSSESFPVPPDSCDSDSSSSSSSSASEGEGEDEQFLRRNRKMPDNWNSVVVPSRGEEEQKKEELEKHRLSDIWGSILSQKADDRSESSSAPYIHPLVKRSKSSLSQKSLEICTESLGSETGSEGFSPYPPSETGDFEDKLAENQSAKATIVELSSPTATPVKQKEELGGESYTSFAETKKSPPRSFPPPLPSLSRREGPGVLMRSHRRDGRLVLEAVPVSNYNYFHAERQGGRLLLSFINKPSAELMESDDEEEEVEEVEEVEEMEEEEDDDVFDEFEEFEEEEETDKVETERKKVQVEGILAEVVKGNQPTLMVTCELLNLRGQAALSTEKNPIWSHTHKKNVIHEEEEEELQHELAQSLPYRVAHLMPSPPTPPAAAAAAAGSFNVYDYFWRPKPAVSAASMHKLTQQQQLPPPPIMDNDNYYSYYYPNKHNNKIIISKSKRINKPQEQHPWRNEADCLVPSIREGCKDSRTKSLFIWQTTRCIATS